MTTLVPPAGGPEVGDRPVIAAPYENLSELTAGLLTLPLVTMTSTWSESPAACVGTLARVMVVPFGLTTAGDPLVDETSTGVPLPKRTVDPLVKPLPEITTLPPFLLTFGDTLVTRTP